MIKDSEIGGYFQLELSPKNTMHADSMHLNTARSCFEYVLRSKKYTKVYLPYYICSVMLDILRKVQITYEFYSIDDCFEIDTVIPLKNGEALLYLNYWGIKSNYVRHLAEIYGSSLIVDNSQAFFSHPIVNLNTFYSARKFFGVADGAYLYMENMEQQSFSELPVDSSSERMLHLLTRIEKGAGYGYKDFVVKEEILSHEGIKKMSVLTDAIMKSIDMNRVRNKRIENFQFLHNHLRDTNVLDITLTNEDVPMIYPYLPKNRLSREKLIKNRIFVAQYWNNVLDYVGIQSVEHDLSKNLLALPIDQRYDTRDMESLLEVIL